MNKDTLSPPAGGDTPTPTPSSKNNNNNSNSNKHNHARYNRDRNSNGPTRGKPRDNREIKENNTLRYCISHVSYHKYLTFSKKYLT